jgi:hypothetical protein
MREALANLLDKLIDLTTKDPATYSRVRYNVVNKEANALLRKAEESGLPVEIIYEVFTRGLEVNNNVNEAFNRVNSFIAGGKAADLDSDLIEDVTDLAKRYKDFVTGGGTPQTASRYKSHVNMLAKKTGQHPIQINKQVRKHVKSMKEVAEPTGGLKDACWSGYTAVGMKMKNGRKVPNCVPKEGLEGAKGTDSNKKLSDYYKKANKKTQADEAYTGSEPTSKDKNDPKNRFVGTDSIVQNYIDATPGQKKPIKESVDLNESFAAGFELAPFARDYGIRVQSSYAHSPDVQEQLDAMEATYKGKTVPLNKPMAGDVKKSKVYVDPDGDGKAKKVNFGDKTLSIKKDQPARKRSYCARSSGQGNLSNKSSANYWSRKAWDC